MGNRQYYCSYFWKSWKMMIRWKHFIIELSKLMIALAATWSVWSMGTTTSLEKLLIIRSNSTLRTKSMSTSWELFAQSIFPKLDWVIRKKIGDLFLGSVTGWLICRWRVFCSRHSKTGVLIFISYSTIVMLNMKHLPANHFSTCCFKNIMIGF